MKHCANKPSQLCAPLPKALPGFTLLEVIAALSIGLLLCALLLQVVQVNSRAPAGIQYLHSQYDALGEMENFVFSYRRAIEARDPVIPVASGGQEPATISEILASVPAENRETLSSLTSTDGSVTLSNAVHKVTFSHEGQTVTAYFVE